MDHGKFTAELYPLNPRNAWRRRVAHSRLVLGSPRTFLSYADSNCGSGECFALHVFTTGVERYGRKRHLKTYAVGRSFGAPFSLSRRIMSSTDVVDAM